MHVVLVEPEIPQNTGNIVRTCAVTGTTLHLVHPLGFSIDDRHLKRAGLDYWDLVEIHSYDSLSEFMQQHGGKRLYFFTTKGGRWYSEINFERNDFLVFGKETAGLPPAILAANPDRCLRIPMIPGARSLNLSNSVAVVLYEALRQQGFKNLT
ncbi:MAG: tRNA (uridine(34)/cytosine(34)/5-carboxymethylaminomethyluridine(34)-2'-O)-methyltransferase TrmL [Syntrophomonadaceae bacterium]|nr:tRNA (uridine(34)/cytosine(34)/5-carboxymethylaminomethyluridine(34)-2'-O)-methyltransferase TrmL [Syntrophomonadaceae bacterium]